MLLYNLHGICKNKKSFSRRLLFYMYNKDIVFERTTEKTKFLTKLEYGNMFKEMKNHFFYIYDFYYLCSFVFLLSKIFL